MIQTTAFPRAAIIGNPSDGYHGKTIAFVFDNFQASVTISTSDAIIISSNRSKIKFENLAELIQSIDSGCYDNDLLADHKLVLATIKYYKDQFEQDIPNFQITYHSTIPISVGLAGSSAIIKATITALMEFTNTTIDKYQLPHIILEIEKRELGIEGGLQDRVAQVYEEPLFMYFHPSDQHPYGQYDVVSGIEQYNWYIAYPARLAESSSITHNNLRKKYDDGDSAIMKAMKTFGQLSIEMKSAIQEDNLTKINTLINKNFDLRQSIMPIDPRFQNTIQVARSTGASAKFTGSGGAIIGLYQDEKQLSQLSLALRKISVLTFIPKIINK